jgi:hypothetical protein
MYEKGSGNKKVMDNGMVRFPQSITDDLMVGWNLNRQNQVNIGGSPQPQKTMGKVNSKASVGKKKDPNNPNSNNYRNHLNTDHKKLMNSK